MNSGIDSGDLFESRLAQLKFIAQGLWGGYYEQVNATCGNVKPKSDRDIWLAKRIDELVVQSEFLLMNQPTKLKE